ncbi:hypothetical protein L861_17265 [Litchfieldella anticariensis FP35 = DSM 16096]|uniref:Thioesterase domain-containing protein n=1 Tax=Litchfieldella anticariensis (strain DSM 16096 / CECT 5854 / CIP 108499 / LMG 22089 / FP35) TaxID=1121939 RepID=S2KME0_LITA3|nr:thioesterase family protein [Halomonas anticariensis]EPC03292.1 hypothetical protein L861_17265 [Halomonas anticariensis FP35 = DSM 16096]
MESYRICFADTDAMGVVYHARYFEMAERSRIETMRRVGVDTNNLFRGGAGIAMVLRRAVARFATPALVDDLLTTQTSIPRHTSIRYWWQTDITRSGESICTIEAECVCIDLITKQPASMPPEIASAIDNIINEGAALAGAELEGR